MPLREKDRGHGEFTGESRREIGLLWFGLLGAPLAFLVELSATFALVEWTCETGHRWLMWAVTLAGIAVAIAAGLVAFRSWRRIGFDPEPEGEGVETSGYRSTGHAVSHEYRTDAPGAEGRSRFMALAGIGTSLFFLSIILVSMFPPLVISPCY